MDTYRYLLDLAIILISTKLLGLLTRRVQMPQVVGALLAGLILGPAGFGILSETSFIHEVAEIGVIVLMFTAGMETDIKELKASGKASFIIALCGVIVPLIGGYGVAWFFNRPSMAGSNLSSPVVLQNVFIGVVLTATSVSITVETLKELGALKSRSGNAILGAAIIDDVLGIIALTIVTSLADDSVKIGMVLIKIVGFFVFSGVVGFVFYKMYKKWVDGAEKELHRHTIIAFVFCLLMAFIAEEVFGVADITGAYVAGVILCNINDSNYVDRRVNISSYMFFGPIFFASIGLKTDVSGMTWGLLAFSVAFVLVALVGKIIGCGLAAKITRHTWKESLICGIGMMTRGEVALIVSQKGLDAGLITAEDFTPVILLIITSSVIVPILLKVLFKNKKGLSEAKMAEITNN